MPVPVTWMTSFGLFGSLETMMMPPRCNPTPLGVNVTLKPNDWPGFKTSGWVASKPAGRPLTAYRPTPVVTWTWETVSGPPPASVTVTNFCFVTGAPPTVAPPKLLFGWPVVGSVARLTETCPSGVKPLPSKTRVKGEPASLDVMVNVSAAAPATAGSNSTFKVMLCSGARVMPAGLVPAIEKPWLPALNCTLSIVRDAPPTFFR